jgi:hypothetical protein
MFTFNNKKLMLASIVSFVVLAPGLPIGASGLEIRPEWIIAPILFIFLLINNIKLDSNITYSFIGFIAFIVISSVKQSIVDDKFITTDLTDIVRICIFYSLYSLFIMASKNDNFRIGIIKVLMMCAFISSLVAILQQFDVHVATIYSDMFRRATLDSINYEFLLRSTGTFGNPNHMGYFLALILILVFGLNYPYKLIYRLILLFTLLSAMFLTGSRSSFGSFICGFFTLLLFSKDRNQMLIEFAMISTLIIFLFISIAAILGIDLFDFFPRFLLMFEDKYIESFDQRLELSEDLVTLVINNLFFGHGASKIGFNLGTNVDNELTLIFFRYGFFGFLAYISIYFGLFSLKNTTTATKSLNTFNFNSRAILFALGVSSILMAFFGGFFYFDRIFMCALLISALIRGAHKT